MAGRAKVSRVPRRSSDSQKQEFFWGDEDKGSLRDKPKKIKEDVEEVVELYEPISDIIAVKEYFEKNQESLKKLDF